MLTLINYHGLISVAHSVLDLKCWIMKERRCRGTRGTSTLGQLGISQGSGNCLNKNVRYWIIHVSWKNKALDTKHTVKWFLFWLKRKIKWYDPVQKIKSYRLFLYCCKVCVMFFATKLEWIWIIRRLLCKVFKNYVGVYLHNMYMCV